MKRKNKSFRDEHPDLFTHSKIRVLLLSLTVEQRRRILEAELEDAIRIASGDQNK